MERKVKVSELYASALAWRLGRAVSDVSLLPVMIDKLSQAYGVDMDEDLPRYPMHERWEEAKLHVCQLFGVPRAVLRKYGADRTRCTCHDAPPEVPRA